MSDDLKKLEARLAALEQRFSRLEARLSSPAPVGPGKIQKELSIKEFILERRPTNDVERTLAIGYFLERFTGATSFNVDDLARQFEHAKEPTPDNINHKVFLNVKKGHMAEAREKKDSKKAWMLTNSGESFVEAGFKSKAR